MADNCYGGVCYSPSGAFGGYRGTGKPQSYWQQQADLVRSGTLGRETTRLATAHQLSELGRSAYMDLYPEVYGGKGGFHVPDWAKRGYEEVSEIEDLRDLMTQFKTPEGAFVRWMLQNRINFLAQRAFGKGGLEPREGRVREAKMPIPDWMEEYITYKTVPDTGRREIKGQEKYQRERKIPTLIPLSAQERLDPEQQMALAGLQAWSKSLEHKMGIEGASDISRWWSPYVSQSQAMFSRGTTKPRWRTAVQR